MISATTREEEFVAYRILEKMEDLPHDEYRDSTMTKTRS